jgi:hypothetical protein
MRQTSVLRQNLLASLAPTLPNSVCFLPMLISRHPNHNLALDGSASDMPLHSCGRTFRHSMATEKLAPDLSFSFPHHRLAVLPPSILSSTLSSFRDQDHSILNVDLSGGGFFKYSVKTRFRKKKIGLVL